MAYFRAGQGVGGCPVLAHRPGRGMLSNQKDRLEVAIGASRCERERSVTPPVPGESAAGPARAHGAPLRGSAARRTNFRASDDRCVRAQVNAMTVQSASEP